MHAFQTFSNAVAGVLMVLALNAWAVESPSDVLLETAEAKLTRADYEAGLARIPADLREEFATSPRRLTLFLNNLLISKTMAGRARLQGLQPEPGTAQDTPADVERALAAAETRAIEEAAGKEFDAKRDALMPAARETYLLAKDEFNRPEQVRLSAILISTDGRGDDAALALAVATRDKLRAWADFAALAKDVSEDKDSAAEGGHLPWAAANQMDPILAKAAFDLKVGEISEPVKVDNSYLVLRLDERRPAGKIPFDDVKDSIMARMRIDYINNAREAQLDAIRSDPTMKVNQEAVNALVIHVAPELYKVPVAPTAPAAAPAPK
jgi:peptidyl-prolyl cis-trans isomerase C